MTSAHERQTALKKQLRENFASGDGAGCWAWIFPNDYHCDSRNSYVAREGELVRMTGVNSQFYNFISHGRHYQTLQPDHYLLHESEFVVKWVRDGPNVPGSMLYGAESELDWFMHRDS